MSPNTSSSSYKSTSLPSRITEYFALFIKDNLSTILLALKSCINPKIKLDNTTTIKTIFDHWLNMAKIIAIPNNKKLKKVKRFFAIIFKTLLPFVLFNLLALPSRVNFVTSSLLNPVLK